jgi:hypothetical protein
MESIWTLDDLERRARRKADADRVAREQALADKWEQMQRQQQQPDAQAKKPKMKSGGRVRTAKGNYFSSY